jgi:hypothetical protein
MAQSHPAILVGASCLAWKMKIHSLFCDDCCLMTEPGPLIVLHRHAFAVEQYFAALAAWQFVYSSLQMLWESAIEYASFPCASKTLVVASWNTPWSNQEVTLHRHRDPWQPATT